jgi:hypothetical protein
MSIATRRTPGLRHHVAIMLNNRGPAEFAPQNGPGWHTDIMGNYAAAKIGLMIYYDTAFA